jgi:hypothetical protein
MLVSTTLANGGRPPYAPPDGGAILTATEIQAALAEKTNLHNYLSHEKEMQGGQGDDNKGQTSWTR